MLLFWIIISISVFSVGLRQSLWKGGLTPPKTGFEQASWRRQVGNGNRRRRQGRRRRNLHPERREKLFTVLGKITGCKDDIIHCFRKNPYSTLPWTPAGCFILWGCVTLRKQSSVKEIVIRDVRFLCFPYFHDHFMTVCQSNYELRCPAEGQNRSSFLKRLLSI